MKLLLILTLLLTGCSTTSSRLNRSYRRLSQIKKETPSCVWSGNCPQAKGMFAQLSEVK